MIIDSLDIGAEIEEAQSDLCRAVSAAEREDLDAYLAALTAAQQRIDFGAMMARYELERRRAAVRCEQVGKAA